MIGKLLCTLKSDFELIDMHVYHDVGKQMLQLYLLLGNLKIVLLKL